MRKLTQRVSFLSFLLVCCTLLASAQKRTITGNVFDENNVPVPGVTITVRGTTTASLTNESGAFTISAASTDELVFSHINFETRSMPAGSGAPLRVALSPRGGAMDDVVITAEFGMKRVARSVGSSHQVVNGATITESGRDNFISALAGRVPGLNVTSTSGTPGASNTVVLRNLTSISGNNQPLYVVDGIPMNNSTFDPLGMAGGETYSVRNMDYSSRGNDFNPEDIASITVLKGAAAAALYGSDASNGAIIITTKKGRAGRGRVTYSNSFRYDKAYGWPEQQTKYNNGVYGTTNYYNSSKFGAEYPAGTKLYDNVDAIMQTGFTERHNLSVEGGTERATIRGGVSYLQQEGVIKTTDYDRFNLSLSGQAKITDWLNFESSMQFTRTNNNKVLRGTDGPLYRAMLWPLVDNMLVYETPDGRMRKPDYYLDYDLLNPLYALNKNLNFDRSNRFISNIAFTITPIRNAFLRAQVGWDVGTQTFQNSWHPNYGANNQRTDRGRYDIVQANFSDPTINIIGGYNKKFFNDRFSFGAQVGYHQLENGVVRQTTNGTKFVIPDFQSINNTDPLSQTANQRNTKRRIQAVSGQFEFGYNNIAFIALRARNDWSSTLPVANNSYFYPAVEASFILSDLKFMQSIPAISYIKLRGSIAQVGKDAGPLEIDPQLEVMTSTGGGFRYGFTGPNPNLRPEMTTAREIGFDARFFKNRLNTMFTYFSTYNEDQIVKGFRLSYATGFVLNNMNVGTFKTRGWEASIDGDIIKSPGGLTWNVGVNASRGISEVVYLPENVTEYYNAYTWNSGNIRNGIMVGHPITTLTGRAFLRNEAGQVLIDPGTGVPLVNPLWTVIGDREPKLRFGGMTSLSYKGMRLSALFAGRYKATVVNGTKRAMFTTGNSWESVEYRERGPVVFNGVLRDGNENSKNPTINTIGVDAGLAASSIYGGGDENWLEKNVNYLRLQELRLSYAIPKKLLSRSRIISDLSVFVVGNDLLTWTNYSGIDAVGNTVSAAAGGTGGEGYDVWSIPNPRGITFGISLSLN
ncbi:SusC/RagA family TonB-linked outer membrane protein [Flavisolibacter sp. BT320]|nr:SusC/RagA family TonB-linked outer membrane protein [Flavisolibacter longurius]